ncbi:MAG: hypothetical protein IKO55_13240 [Kiritimatiellae bacterium]|nr:hypothetical protein [Kiritimatiellia bacterium]
MPLKDPEKRRAYRKSRREIDRKREAMRYATDPAFRARKIASAKKYYAQHRETRDKVKRKWADANLDKVRGYVRKSMNKIRLAWRFDSDLYAKGRAYNRMLKAKRTILRGGAYRPHFGYRIPDWAVKGEMILDASSQWLDVNITPSQRAFAREIAMQNKGWRR